MVKQSLQVGLVAAASSAAGYLAVGPTEAQACGENAVGGTYCDDCECHSTGGYLGGCYTYSDWNWMCMTYQDICDAYMSCS